MDDTLTVVLAVLASGGLWEFVKTVYTNRKGIRLEDVAENVKEVKSIQRIIADGQIGLLHERLFDTVDYYKKKGSISEARFTYIFNHIYLPYKKLGGNDNADELIEKLRDMIEDR